MNFPLIITSVDKIIFKGEVESANCPGSQGELTILAGHNPLVTALKEGEIVVKTQDSKEEKFKVQKGMLEVGVDEVTILV